uniref:Complement C3-like n=1 Tax=Pseudopotamilla reniformis TaxID=279639 RepID=A0A2P1L4D5_9ANNE|nr:complement C3-like [Pseudopotamilla reniformis]
MSLVIVSIVLTLVLAVSLQVNGRSEPRIRESLGEKGLLFTTPSVLQKGSKEKACVTLYNLPDIHLSLSLVDEDVSHPLKNITLYDSGCFEWDFGADSGDIEGKYEFQVTGRSSNYRFSKHATVKVEKSKHIVFIQTDKPIYKPGQTVKFRVLVVDSKLKPRLEEITEIFIQDPSGIRMMQWRNVDVAQFQGIADLEMPMSEEPVQGKWKITVITSDDGTTEIQEFKVEEYVLPKYEISLKPPSFIPVNAKTVDGQVCAMYTYGEPVRGVLTLKTCRKRTGYYGIGNSPLPCVETITEINGCKDFSIDAKQLKLNHENMWTWKKDAVQFTASVLENATGITLNSSADTELSRDLYKLDFKKYSPTYFKPGLPYHGKLQVTQPDGSSAVGVRVKIIVNNYSRNKKFEKLYTTDSRGQVAYSLPPLSKQSTSVSISATLPDHENRNENHNSHSTRIIHPFVRAEVHSVKQWYSPSESYIQVEPVEEVAKCGESITLNITHTMELDATDVKIYYKVISHGNQISDGTYTHNYRNSNVRTYAPDGSFTEEELHKCHGDEVWTECTSSALRRYVHCYAICSDPYPTCNSPCIPACRCPAGTVRHEGRCVNPNQCPVRTSCPDIQSWTDCGSACTRTCEVQMMPCTQQCARRCQCPTSKPLWHSGQCVEASACPPPISVDPSASPLDPKGKNPDRPVVTMPLRIPITSEMSPSMKVLVYYIRPDKETVADTAEVNVEQCTANKVKIAFTDAKKYPGDSTTISVTADPGSVCSVGVVDKSVNLMGGKNTLTLSQVLGELSSFDLDESSIPGKDNYCDNKMKGSKRRRYRSVYWGGDRYYSNYLDSMHAFKINGILAMTDMIVNSRPCEKVVVTYDYDKVAYSRSYSSYDNPEGAFEEVEVDEASEAPEPTKPKVDIRTYFPETWLWDLHFVGDTGALTLHEELPHTVTEWTGTGFCSHVSSGLGVSPPTAIKGFQPFFLSLTLPYSVVRGETLKLPVTVFNYLTDCLVVKLSLTSSDDYEVVGSLDADWCVCGQESVTHYYKLTAKTLGEIDITIRAVSIDNNGACGNEVFMSDQIGVRDAVTRKLLIEGEGREEEYTHTAFMCPTSDESTVRETMSLELPNDFVMGTQRAFISVIGDIMGPSLSGLDKLLRQPTGCGEQNMLLFTPNIYVLQYLTSSNQLTTEIKDKALGHMRTGYQRELGYRHDDGSYSAFGKSDDSGSTWLTAFVVKSFAQAKEFITIDHNDLKKSIKWFLTKQRENGCFPKIGRVIHKEMQGGIVGGSNEAALTAFVLVSLLESRSHVNVAGIESAIASGFSCLRQQTVTDMYSISLIAYAHSLRGGSMNQEKQRISRMIREKAIKKEGQTHWSNTNADPDVDDVGWSVTHIHKPKSTDVEMTAYILMSMIESQGPEAVGRGLPVVKWLTAQRNAYGGFSSTQDTVLALQALASYATMAYTNGGQLTVNVNANNDRQTLNVNDDNKLVLQQLQVTLPNSVNVEVSGTGCVLVQASVKYNVANISTEQPAFSLTSTVHRQDTCKVRKLNICAKYEGTDGASNMALITVKMVSGWIPNKDSVKRLRNEAGLGLKRYEIEMNLVNFYFDELTGTETCLSFKVEQDIEVEQAKPGYVKVEDYYNNELSVTRPYEIKQICGTKEELPDISWEEFDRKNEGDHIEQVRVPSGPRPREDGAIGELHNGEGNEDRVPVDEPLIVPEHVEPLGSETCPLCLETEPEDFMDKFCAADKAYKVTVRGHSRFPVKIMYDMRSRNKPTIGKIASLDILGSCTCSPLKKQFKNRKAMILTTGTEYTPAAGGKVNLALNGQSLVVLFPSSRTQSQNLDRRMRQKVKQNRCP